VEGFGGAQDLIPAQDGVTEISGAESADATRRNQ
jgi:hypothetical protein